MMWTVYNLLLLLLLIMLIMLILCRKEKLEDAYQHHRFLTDAREHVSMCVVLASDKGINNSIFWLHSGSHNI